MVPAVWIEHTTYRLQGGCSTAELSRHINYLLHLSGRHLSDDLSGRHRAIIALRRPGRLGPTLGRLPRHQRQRRLVSVGVLILGVQGPDGEAREISLLRR